jgi:hypothetical protein
MLKLILFDIPTIFKGFQKCCTQWFWGTPIPPIYIYIYVILGSCAMVRVTTRCRPWASLAAHAAAVSSWSHGTTLSRQYPTLPQKSFRSRPSKLMWGHLFHLSVCFVLPVWTSFFDHKKINKKLLNEKEVGSRRHVTTSLRSSSTKPYPLLKSSYHILTLETPRRFIATSQASRRLPGYFSGSPASEVALKPHCACENIGNPSRKWGCTSTIPAPAWCFIPCFLAVSLFVFERRHQKPPN